jgi:hypothetical protein
MNDSISQLNQVQGTDRLIISLEPVYRQAPGMGMASNINIQPNIVQAAPLNVAPLPAVNQAPSAPSGKATKATVADGGDSSDEKGSNVEEGNQEIWSSSKANRRTKERKISFVIEKVSMWRKLYNGIQDNQGKIVRYR